jgi:lysozyme family protein
MTAFDSTFDRLIGNEGGYSNDPADPGGETNWGISKRSYPNVDIKKLTKDGAKAIYLMDFWSPLSADKMHPQLVFSCLTSLLTVAFRLLFVTSNVQLALLMMVIGDRIHKLLLMH